MASSNLSIPGTDPLRNYLESRDSLANKREDMLLATRELRTALRLMQDLLGRCLEAEPIDANAIAALEREYEETAGHLLSLAMCVTRIAETLKVSL